MYIEHVILCHITTQILTTALFYCTIPSMPTTCFCGTAKKKAVSKQNISDALSEPEDDVPTKKSKPSTGAGQHQQQQLLASLITPPNGPCKCTNEHPGLIGKKG